MVPRMGYVWIDLEFHWNYTVRRDSFLLEAELYRLIESDDVLFQWADESGEIDVKWNSIGLYTKVTADPLEVAIKERYYPWNRPMYCDALADRLRSKHIRFHWRESPSPIESPNTGQRILNVFRDGNLPVNQFSKK